MLEEPVIQTNPAPTPGGLIGVKFDTDAGWRIDYQLATPALAKLSQTYRVDRAPSYDTRWSDHSPVVVEYEL